jgi:predicted metalloendopeptidase
MEADDAVNYGAIGAVIGHEISHGFDDKGSQFDGQGNIKNWWQEEDRKEFEKRADVMVREFNSFNPIDTLHINGELTLGENIADLGGLTIAYYAYKNALKGKEAPVIDGFTGEQRFFLGWAQFWARKYRDETLRQRLLTDPHSPSEYRVNGIVVSMPEFYQAFNVHEQDGMYLAADQRVKIW